MGPERTIEFQGRPVKGRSIDFESKGENWNQYSLEDGSILKIKTVLMEVVRLDHYNDNGDPTYQFVAQQIVSVQVAENLRKKPH